MKLILPIFGLVALILIFVFDFGKSSADLDGFALCLTEKGIVMFGAYWCPHCQNEKDAFGDSFKYVNYIECTEKPQECLAKEIKGYPTWIFPNGRKLEGEQGIEKLSQESGCPVERPSEDLEESFLPANLNLDGLGEELMKAGVVDGDKLSLGEEDRFKNPENPNDLLNFLWAFGLANKNEILENGPMADPQYGGPGVFASTGGWTLAVGDTMEHYSRHSFVVLSEEQQELVEQASKNIFRPCCSNPAYFPDCNHGMAMLGLLELMASQGFFESQMFETAEVVNSFWFPASYNSDCSA